MKFLFALLAISFAFAAKSQTAAAVSNTIYKRNKEVLLVKITEIGIDEIKYKPVFNPSDIVLVIEKSLVEKIVFASGITQYFEDPATDKANYTGNHTHNLKFQFLSPISDRIGINWEHSLKPGQSIETGFSAIGIGKRYGAYTPVGAAATFGYRFYRMPDMKSRSDRYSHIMNGSYFQPMILLSQTSRSYDIYHYEPWPQYGYYTAEKRSTTAFAFMLNIGKQYVFANRLSFDFTAGIGYGVYNYKSTDYNRFNELTGIEDEPGRYGFLIGDKSTPIALNASIRIGYLFN